VSERFRRFERRAVYVALSIGLWTASCWPAGGFAGSRFCGTRQLSPRSCRSSRTPSTAPVFPRPAETSAMNPFQRGYPYLEVAVAHHLEESRECRGRGLEYCPERSSEPWRADLWRPAAGPDPCYALLALVPSVTLPQLHAGAAAQGITRRGPFLLAGDPGHGVVVLGHPTAVARLGCRPSPVRSWDWASFSSGLVIALLPFAIALALLSRGCGVDAVTIAAVVVFVTSFVVWLFRCCGTPRKAALRPGHSARAHGGFSTRRSESSRRCTSSAAGM